VSHSHEIGLIAISDVSDLTAVGVDIERYRELSDLVAISRRYFTLSERQSLLP
jgi:phosphopantetheinyl transferase